MQSVRPPFQVPGTFAHFSCSISSSLDGLLQITKVMLENDHKLSEASFTFAIKAAAFQGEVDFARKLLAVRNTVHFRPREELYVSVSTTVVFCFISQ